MIRTIGIIAMLLALGAILAGCATGPTKEQAEKAQTTKAEKADK